MAIAGLLQQPTAQACGYGGTAGILSSTSVWCTPTRRQLTLLASELSDSARLYENMLFLVFFAALLQAMLCLHCRALALNTGTLVSEFATTSSCVGHGHDSTSLALLCTSSYALVARLSSHSLPQTTIALHFDTITSCFIASSHASSTEMRQVFADVAQFLSMLLLAGSL